MKTGIIPEFIDGSDFVFNPEIQKFLDEQIEYNKRIKEWLASPEAKEITYNNFGIRIIDSLDCLHLKEDNK